MYMKSLLIFLIVNFVIVKFAISQSGISVNTTGAVADASAILDVSSTAQGTLITRMTTAQRDAIISPAESLLIFNVTTKCLEMYVNGGWYSVSCPAACPLPVSPAEGSNMPSQSQIVWNWNIVSGASGYKWNTAEDYNSANDNGAGNAFTQPGLTCNTSYSFYVWAYNSCGHSSPLSLSQNTDNCNTTYPCSINNSTTITVTHNIGNIAPVSETVIYNIVQSDLTGNDECWLAQNLGAVHQASSFDDASDANGTEGWIWQFNRIQGYRYADDGTRTPSSWDNTNDNTFSGWDPAKDPCPLLLGSGWRLPTITEWQNVTSNGHFGNLTDAFNSILKMNAVGYVDYTTGIMWCRGVCSDNISEGYFWASSQDNNTIGSGWLFCNDIYPGGSRQTYAEPKAAGRGVRCLNP
jgi:uncharacterized protein (TIGR02145 family)